MAFEAEFYYGNVNTSIPYTPSGADVEAGQVVVLGELVGIAPVTIPDGVLGALNIMGGVYKCVAAGAYAVGLAVYWDDTANKVTTNAAAGANKKFGNLVAATSGDGGQANVFHNPA